MNSKGEQKLECQVGEIYTKVFIAVIISGIGVVWAAVNDQCNRNIKNTSIVNLSLSNQVKSCSVLPNFDCATRKIKENK